MRELTNYREQLSKLDDAFPEKTLLTKTDIYIYLGISRNTLKKRFPQLWKSPYTSKVELARMLARM